MNARRFGGRMIGAVMALAWATICVAAPQTTFETPDKALEALVKALRAHDKDALGAILGPGSDEVITSGDEVADKNTVDRFLLMYDAKHSLAKEEDGSMSVVVGDSDWPMPIPIVKTEDGKGWVFDTEAGKDEIISRRVGRNELEVIQVCMAIVDAQREYCVTNTGEAGGLAYAQKFVSDPGKKNGLYWDAAATGQASPLGDVFSEAAAEGYDLAAAKRGERRPYHGYFYRMMLEQGPNATGGKMNFIIGGRMIGGFAAVAYPAEYGASGVMTFMVNQEGVLYQRDLGEDTEKIATEMTSFDPSPEWTKVEAPAPPPPDKP